MTRSCSCLVLAAVIQVIFGEIPSERLRYNMQHPYQQMIPEHCWHPPPGTDVHKCCPRPSLYPEEVLDSCGIEKLSEEDSNVQVPKKVPCQDGICLMTKSNLLMANGSIDFEKLRTYIDQWAAEHPNFTEAILAAKPLCAKPKHEFRNIGETKMCEPDIVFVCLQSHMFWNCKLKEEFEECQHLREHMDECKPYYMKPKDFDEKWSNRNKDFQKY